MIEEWYDKYKKLDKKGMWYVVGMLLVCMIIGGVFLLSQSNQTILQQPSAVLEQSTVLVEEQTTQEPSRQWYVDVKGAVRKPGVYPVGEQMRVKDVIDLAGGVSPEADVNQVNFAQLVSDEMVVVIPTVHETAQTVTIPQSRKVNLNTASKEELMTLKGIGEKKAEAIIVLREQSRLRKLDDLKQIKGMSDKIIETLKEHVSL